LRNHHQLHVSGDVQKRPPSARVASRSPDSCSSEVVFTAMQAERSFYMTRAQRHVARTDTYGRTAGTIHTLISSSSAAIRATRTTELSRYVPLRQKFACATCDEGPVGSVGSITRTLRIRAPLLRWCTTSSSPARPLVARLQRRWQAMRFRSIRLQQFGQGLMMAIIILAILRYMC
jgi:hypothetical protein